MPVSIGDQFDMAMNAVPTGDIDLLAQMLTYPDTITPEQQADVASKLGIKGGFLRSVVNIATDPVVLASFLLSRRFPTLAWLKGTTPHRFVGMNAEFTGISQYTRPIETYFRGTTIPKLVALKMRRESEVLRIGQKMFDTMNRPGWKEDMPTVSLLMEGQNPAAATPELRQVASSLRANMDEMWGLLHRTQKITGGFMGDEITPAVARPFRPSEAPKYLRDYLPHIPILGDESIITVSGAEALKKMGGGRVAQALQLKGEHPGQVWGVGESDQLASSFGRYQTFMNNVGAEVYNPRLFKRHRSGIPLESHTGQELFVTDLNVILQKYAHSVARTYANNAPLTEMERALAATRIEDAATGVERVVYPSRDPIVVQIINEGLKVSGVQLRNRPVMGTHAVEQTVVPNSGNVLSTTALRHLVRSVQGAADEGEMIWGNLFSSVASKFDRATGVLTKRQRTEVDHTLRTLEHTRNFRNTSAAITSFFYASTLGMNSWSVLQNTLQPMLTTAPTIGIGPTLAGMRTLREKIPMYARELRAARGRMAGRGANPLHRFNEAAQESFNKVFPELAESGIRLDPRLFDIDPNSMVGIGNSKWFRNYDDYAKFILQPFTHAELANQVTTFYGARHAIGNALRTGEMEIPLTAAAKPLAGDALRHWMDFEAGQVVNATQFRPGPGSRTIWQGSVPSFARMFTSFPVRLLSLMQESTVRGAMTNAQLRNAGMLEQLLGGRNLGTLARMVMYGRIVTEGARETLGADLSDQFGLTVPFTFAPKGQPLYPLPIPPVAGVAYGLVSAATNRDIKRMQPLELPGIGVVPMPKLLMPGGMQVTRMTRVMNQFRPDMGGFVDDNERLMYRGNTSDYIMAMLGIPLEKNRRAREAIGRVQDTRSRMRQFRRAYAMARINNDWAGMRKLQAQYAKAFPDMVKSGIPLTVSDEDVNRYRANARLPAVQRMMQTMGASGRFLESQLYEYDPDILAPPELMGLRAA